MNPADVEAILQSTRGRGDTAYLAIAILLFCVFVMSGYGWLSHRIYMHAIGVFRNEMREERELHTQAIAKLEADSKKRAAESHERHGKMMEVLKDLHEWMIRNGQSA